VARGRDPNPPKSPNAAEIGSHPRNVQEVGELKLAERTIYRASGVRQHLRPPELLCHTAPRRIDPAPHRIRGMSGNTAWRTQRCYSEFATARRALGGWQGRIWRTAAAVFVLWHLWIVLIDPVDPTVARAVLPPRGARRAPARRIWNCRGS